VGDISGDTCGVESVYFCRLNGTCDDGSDEPGPPRMS
jgi:hypothetical protein